jgi:hypothetical protein
MRCNRDSRVELGFPGQAIDLVVEELGYEISDARSLILDALADERLVAEGIPDDRRLDFEKMQPGWWLTWDLDRGLFNFDFDLRLPHLTEPRIKTIINCDESWARRVVDGTKFVYHSVRIKRQAVRELVHVPRRKNAGGRSFKFDWDGFWVEIARIAELDGLPDRSSLRCHMIEFTSTWPEQPDESEIRKRLSLLYGQPWISSKV